MVTVKNSIKIIIIALLAVTAYSQEDPYVSELDSLLSIPIQTSSKYMRKANETAASVTIITANDIASHGYRTLDEVLSTVKGFYTSYDRNYVYVGVRGFGRPSDYNNRILLLIDGHTVNESFFGSSPFGTDLGIDLRAVKRIEIVRGPGSALYGSGAMLAVINIVTREGIDIDGGTVRATLGSFGRREVSAVAGTRFDSGVDLAVTGSWGDIQGRDLYFTEFDTDSTNRGIAQGLDWDRFYTTTARVRYRHFSLAGYFIHREKGLPTAPWDAIFNDRRARTTDRYNSLEAKYRRDLNPAVGFMTRGYYDGYYYTGTYPEDMVNDEDTRVHRFGSEMQLRWDISPAHRLLAGVEVIRVAHADLRVWYDGEPDFEKNYPFTVISGYVQDELQLSDRVTFVAGLRKDGYSSFTIPVSPRIGTVIHPFNSSTVKLLAGQAFRAPNIYEYNYEYPGWYKTNPDLKPERITAYEAIWDQRITEGLHGSVSVFRNEIKNLIDQIEDPADGLIYYDNIHRARADGVEVEFLLRDRSGVHAGAAYAYQNARDRDDGTVLTNSPVHVLKGTLSLPLTREIRAGTDIRHESSKVTVWGSRTSPYTLVNIFAERRFALHGAIESSLSMRINNVFNKTYATPGGFEHRQAFIIQNGRNFLLGVSLSL
jgi:outer membrane receptor for ferrienterochelin and colicin